jgi:hypothetical protein
LQFPIQRLNTFEQCLLIQVLNQSGKKEEAQNLYQFIKDQNNLVSFDQKKHNKLFDIVFK